MSISLQRPEEPELQPVAVADPCSHCGACLSFCAWDAADREQRPTGPELCRTLEDVAIGADHQHIVEAIDGQGGQHGPGQEPLGEILAFLGVKRPTETRLGALERPDRDDRRHPCHEGDPNASTARARRARPG